MSKAPMMNLEGMLTARHVDTRPAAGGVKQLTVKIDLVTYRRLRQCALDKDMTHQDILEQALQSWLNARG